MGKRETVRVALTGNPNVGKSTVFNALTGMHRHTGNWSGKTVDLAVGSCLAEGKEFIFTDLPGCYSLDPHSAEEAVAGDCLRSGDIDAAVIVCDASLLERNLILALRIAELCPHSVLVLNLIDEAEKKGILVDREALEAALGIPVVLTAARSGRGLSEIPRAVLRSLALPPSEKVHFENAEAYAAEAERLSKAAVRRAPTHVKDGRRSLDRRADKILTGRFTALPVMLLLLCGIMWLTVKGANYPSSLLFSAFERLGEIMRGALTSAGLPSAVVCCLTDGVYRVTSWVISVMLPPMAIFFPLFTLLEDLGYLPRVAFVLDRLFKGCGSCGKQALTMCMGLGCNAAGVVGCRIIDSERERRIAVLTNSLVPCNGKFPALLCICTVFFSSSAAGAAVWLTLIIVLGVAVTLLASRILSSTLLRGVPSSFALELPPYRIPRVGSVIVRSVFDRTLYVLRRAVSAAAPAGFIIWLFSGIRVGSDTLLQTMARVLDPVGSFLGLDGVILTAFILGLPANEIVLPIAAMGYMASGALTEVSVPELGALLKSCGWDCRTAAAAALFSMFHWPCSTTLLTVRKETGSTRMMLLAAGIPTVFGVSLCLLLRGLCFLAGLAS